ncbi:MAG: DegT/DnrJ/EryC1/StrS family aminotransferase [Bacteroidia bacterium]|nr:DegT/DnrJ/EryC1/StrS family aminotransferase [Bacteroidia bacterium]MDW8157970.1 DegT/DnrJ/EryC1/StrS family aminotransferase [Bacteroidia bacterium]
MKPIQMVDIVSQYQKNLSQLMPLLEEVFQTAAFINGPQVKAFAQELAQFLGDSVIVIPCANGTDALQLAFMELALQVGDEVLVPDFTFISTVEVLKLLGLKPVFVDIDLNTFCICPYAAEKLITPRTKAIVPVHLFGQCAPMEKILELAETYNLYVIEDTAQAIGAEYIFKNGTTKKAGTIAQVGCTSFYPSKNLGCYGDGGAVFTKDAQRAARLQMIANHGQREKYYYETIGINSRLDSLQAAILRVNLQHLPTYTQKRQLVAQFYNQAFEKVEQIVRPSIAPYSTHVFHQYTIRVPAHLRNQLVYYLSDKKIPSAIFYPVPIHQQKPYREPELGDALYPNTIRACQEVLSLPIHPEMEDAQMEYIAEHIIAFFENY